MQHAHRIARLSALALGIAGALTLGQVHASGFQLRESSIKNLGRGQAGQAIDNGDGSVVAINPAAMATFEKRTVQADLTVIDLTADFTGGGATATTLGPPTQANPAGAPVAGTPLTGGDGGDPGDATLVPALAAVFPMSGVLDDFTFGASISAPFGLKTEYDRDWVGRYNAVESEVKTADLTLSAAFRVNNQLSLGLGVIWERAEATLSNAIDFGTAICGRTRSCASPASPFRPQANDGFFQVHGSDTGMGIVGGLQWTPSEKFTLGYSYRSEIDHDLEGTLDFTVPASVTAALGPAGAAYADGAGGAQLTTPAVETLSARFAFNDDFRLLADVQDTHWRSLRSVIITRANGTVVGNESFNWKDTRMIAVGAEFDLSDSLTLRGGVAKDESPTNDRARTPRLPDNDRMLYAMGVTWNMSENLSFDAAFQRIQIDTPTVDVVSSSGSRLVGSFDGYANLYGVSAQYRF